MYYNWNLRNFLELTFIYIKSLALGDFGSIFESSNKK